MLGNFSEFEPNFESSFDFDIEMKQAVLDEALKQFSDAVLSNDTLYELIKKSLLEDSDSDATQLPEFGVSPVVKNGTRSICITTSIQADAGEERNDNGDVALLTYSFGTMKYIHVCDFLVNEETGALSIAVKKSFVEAVTGKDLSIDKPTAEEGKTIEQSARTFLRAMNEIDVFCKDRGVEVLTDDSGHPVVREVLERTYTATDTELF